MGRKGWWRQLRDQDFPTTKTNYGDPLALENPRRDHNNKPRSELRTTSGDPVDLDLGSTPKAPEETGAQQRLPQRICCIRCGSERWIDRQLAKTLRAKLQVSTLDRRSLNAHAHKFRCKSCRTRGEVCFG